MSTRSGSSSVAGHHNPYLVKRSYSTPCENNSGGDSSDVVMMEEGSGGGPSGSIGRSLKMRMSKTPPMTPMRDNNNKSNKSGNNNPGKMIAFKILLLDDSVTIIQAQTKALGRLVFDQICKQLNVLESDYFGLEYNDEQGVTYWLDLEKRLTRQVGLSPVEPNLKFSVKFYTPDPSQLEEEFTRYLFSLQIKRDLANGTLQCNDNTAALMASFIVQAECGDFSEEDYPDPTYLSVFKFVPHQKYDLERKIRENHKKHIGQSPAEADLHLLETARRTELYGVRVHPAKDEDGVNLNLSVCHMGVLVFQNMTKINTFSWAKIRKISFKRKRFILKLHPETYFQEGYYKELVEFIFDSRNECKAYWKRCVEHHAFFRCEKAPNPIHRSKGILSSRGSSFRYSGRTQKQMVAFVRENFIKRPANQYHSMSQQNLSTMGVSSFDTQSQHQSHGLPYNTSQPHQFQRSSSFKTHQQQLQQQQQAQQQRPFYGERPGILGSQQAVTNSRSSPAMISDERVEERQTNYDDEEELEEEEEEDEEEEFSDYVVDNEKGSGGRRQKSTGTHPPPIGKPLPPDRVTTPDTSVTSSPVRAEDSPYKPVQQPPQHLPHQPAQVSVYYGHGGGQGHGDYMQQQVRHQSYHHHQPGGGLVLRNGTIGPSGTHYRSNAVHYGNQPLEHPHSHTLGRTPHSHSQHHQQQQQQQQQYYYAHLPPHPQQPQNNLGHTRSSSMNYYDSKVTPTSLPPDWYYYMTKELLNIYRTYAQDIRLLKSYEKGFPFFQATLNLSRSFKQNIEDIKKEVWESRNGNEILYQLIKYFEQYKPSYLDYFNYVSTSYTKICLNDLSNHYISKCCLYLRPFEFIKYLYIDLVQGILLPQFSNANYLNLNSPTNNANNVNNNINPGMHNVSFSSFKSNSNSSQNLNNSFSHLLDCKLVDKLVKTLELLYYKSDELKRGIQTKSKVLELHKELHGFPLLDDKAGDFIRQGILLKLNKKRGLQNRIFFLFRDVMAYGSRINSSQGFRLHGIIPTSQMELNETNQVEINGIPHSFIVNVNQELESFGSNSTIHQKILVLAAFNEKDKVAWTEGIALAIKYSMRIEGVNQLLINNYNSSEEILKSTSESLELQPIIVQQQQHRSNATTHVCWHRNLSVSSEMLLKAYGCTISGYLLRKFKNSPGWQRLWVVYTNVCLYFYKSHHEEDHSEEELPLASLPLLGYRVEVPNDSDNIHKDHVFKLSFKNHVYFFRAESPFTFQRWVSTLKASTSLASYAAPTAPPPSDATRSNVNYS